MKQKLIFIFTLLVALLTAVYQTVEACNPTPPQNLIDCRSLGAEYPYGFRLNGDKEGKFPISSRYGQLTGGAPYDPTNYVRMSDNHSTSFDWSSSLKIKAVIVQTNGKPKVYKYDGATEASDLRGARDSRGRYYPILKVDFCYDYTLTVTQTTQGTVTQTADWDITKTAAAPEQWKFIGDTAKFDYTVAVNKTTTGTDSGYRLTSTVTIKNETPLPAVITSIKDILSSGNTELKLNCGNIRFPYTLPAGKTLTCTAEKSLTVKTDGEVKVIVSVCSDSKVHGGSTSGKIDWTGVVDGGGSITVTDTNSAFQGPYTVTDNKSWTYTVEIACPKDPAVYTNGEWTTTLDNIAAIKESGKQASQSVKLHCYMPNVNTTTSTSYSSKYTWAIKKTSPSKNVTASLYDYQSLSYTVDVSIASQSEANYQLAGVVTVANPNPSAPLTIALADEVAPGQPVAFTDCTSPVTIPMGGQVTCHFVTPMSTKAAGTNTVQFNYNDIAFTATAPYNFDNSQVVDATDECVNVTDDKVGILGTVCADKAPQTFSYNMTVGPFEDCVTRTFPNTATFVTNDTQATGSDTWTINVSVDCPVYPHCPRQADYWVSSAFPSNAATFDPTWNRVQPSGPESPLFETGYTWLTVLQDSPADSSYYTLARAYVAANLNKLNDSSTATAEVNAAIEHAAALLDEYDTHVGDVSGTSVEEDFTATAQFLDEYNSNRITPE